MTASWRVVTFWTVLYWWTLALAVLYLRDWLVIAP